jgi:hypothetical protein
MRMANWNLDFQNANVNADEKAKRIGALERKPPSWRSMIRTAASTSITHHALHITIAKKTKGG